MNMALNPDQLRLSKWLFDRGQLWQMRLETPSGIDKYSHSRGINSFFMGEYITKLWQLGLLSCDLITATEEISFEGITYLGEESPGIKYYADNRGIRVREDGWGDSIKHLDDLQDKVSLYFHPFRFYVLYHIDRILTQTISPIQTLLSTKMYSKLIQDNINRFNRFTAKPEFIVNARSWNQAAALAIAAEPCFYQTLFNKLSHPVNISDEEQSENILEHWEDVKEWYLNIGLERLEKHRRDLCIAAESLDPNKDVHTILRLTHSDYRMKRVKGKLGGSICLLAMAETLRRGCESAFGEELREEDELGFGVIPIGVKEELYGSERLYDGIRDVKTNWLRSLGLDSGVRLRWYVEGDSEYFALESIVGRYSAIQLENLRGLVVAKGGKGVAFRDSLRDDLKSSTFSFISIDGDRNDCVRMVQKAANEDEICGMFFISSPDFEFNNFTVDELTQILWEMCEDRGAPDDLKNDFHSAISNSENSEELIGSAKLACPLLWNFSKGEEWGKRLMTYAMENPKMIEAVSGNQIDRPFVESVGHALRSVQVDYLGTRENYRVDPESGLPVKRPL